MHHRMKDGEDEPKRIKTTDQSQDRYQVKTCIHSQNHRKE